MPTDRVKLLDPSPLRITVVAVFIPIAVLNSDPRRTGISKRGRLGFSAVPVIMINDEGRAFGGLMIRRREHLVGTRNELVERG